MKKKTKLPNVSVTTLPNGYALTFDGMRQPKGYMYFTLEDLLSRNNPAIDALLKEIDVLVDGRYEEKLRDLTLNFRGSANQRVIDMNAYRKTGIIKTLY